MEKQEMELALEGLKNKVLEGAGEKAKAEVKAAIEAFEAKANGLFADQIKALKESLETEFKAQIKVVQDHADKLDTELQGKAKKIEAEPKPFKSLLNEALTEATDDFAKFQRKESKSFALEIKAVADMTTANVTGGTRYGQLMRDGIILNPNRKVHMTDILPGGVVGPGNTYTFMRENGVGEGDPAPVAEGATKPQFDLDLVESTVNIETIAGWMRVTRKAMNNIPGFVSYLSQRLPEKFLRVLDAQVLYGSGTTPNLKGILTSGNFVAGSAAGTTPLIEKIINDITLLEDTHERDATAILLRPIDYNYMFKNKASGSGEYDLPEVVTMVNGVLQIMGIPVFKTTALTANDYVVGDFDMGAQLLTQEAMRIEFFDQDGTNVRENKVTVRIEGNYALPVYGSNYFVKGSSATA